VRDVKPVEQVQAREDLLFLVNPNAEIKRL